MPLDILRYDSTKNGKYIYERVEDFVDVVNNTPTYVRYDASHSSVAVFQLFLRNPDLTKYYTNVIITFEGNLQIQVTDFDGYPDFITPLVAKLSKGAVQPRLVDWQGIDEFNSITFENIGERNNPDLSYFPFWVAIECMPDYEGGLTGALLDTDLTFKLVYREFSHGQSTKKPIISNRFDAGLKVSGFKTGSRTSPVRPI